MKLHEAGAFTRGDAVLADAARRSPRVIAIALERVKNDNAKVISNSSMTPSAIAERIVRGGTNHGLGWRAICDEISRLRKETRGSDF